MAVRDITGLMNAYRECARNLWNVYFSGRANIGASLDAFGQMRDLLFDSLVLDELLYEEGSEEDGNVPSPILRVVPRIRSLILVQRSNALGQASYWDQEKDLAVEAGEVELEFLGYFDFSQIPIMDFRYYRCRILRFPRRAQYEGKEALIEAENGDVFHHE